MTHYIVSLKEPIDLHIRLQIDRNHGYFIRLQKTFKMKVILQMVSLKCESYCLFLLGYNQGILPVPEAL